MIANWLVDLTWVGYWWPLFVSNLSDCFNVETIRSSSFRFSPLITGICELCRSLSYSYMRYGSLGNFTLLIPTFWAALTSGWISMTDIAEPARLFVSSIFLVFDVDFVRTDCFFCSNLGFVMWSLRKSSSSIGWLRASSSYGKRAAKLFASVAPSSTTPIEAGPSDGLSLYLKR